MQKDSTKTRPENADELRGEIIRYLAICDYSELIFIRRFLSVDRPLIEADDN